MFFRPFGSAGTFIGFELESQSRGGGGAFVIWRCGLHAQTWRFAAFPSVAESLLNPPLSARGRGLTFTGSSGHETCVAVCLLRPVCPDGRLGWCELVLPTCQFRHLGFGLVWSHLSCKCFAQYFLWASGAYAGATARPCFCQPRSFRLPFGSRLSLQQSRRLGDTFPLTTASEVIVPVALVSPRVRPRPAITGTAAAGRDCLFPLWPRLRFSDITNFSAGHLGCI